MRLSLIPNSAAVLIRDPECEDAKIASIVRAIVAHYDNTEIEIPLEYRDICKIILNEVDLMIKKSDEIKERHIASAKKWRKEKAEKDSAQQSIQTGTTMAVVTQQPTRKKVTAKRKSKEDDQDFELFYDSYGKKQDRPGAYAAFMKAKAKPNFPKITDLIVIISKWQQTEQWQEDGGKYQPFPTTWLNREGWLEDLPKPSNKGSILKPTNEEASEYANYF